MHVRAQIYYYFRQCFMQPRALAHHTSALSAVLQRRTCAHTGGVPPRYRYSLAPAARRRPRPRSPVRSGRVSLPAPLAGTDVPRTVGAVRAPRPCTDATWPYFSMHIIQNAHLIRCSLTLYRL